MLEKLSGLLGKRLNKQLTLKLDPVLRNAAEQFVFEEIFNHLVMDLDEPINENFNRLIEES